MRSIEEIAVLYSERRKNQEPWVSEALLLRDLVNGAINPVPVTEETEHTAAANIARRGLEQTAMRVASTQPDPKFPELRPGIKRSEDLARKRRLATLNFWHENKMPILDYKKALWYLGYGMAPTQITPSMNGDKPIPFWHLRDPLTTYPAPTEFQESMFPPDCIYAYIKTFDWLRKHYPIQAFDIETIYRNKQKELRGDQTFNIAEYVDAEERVLMVLGIRSSPFQTLETYGADGCMKELSRVPNRADICPVVIPRLVNLDRPRSSYADSIGMFIMRDKLMRLEYINAKRTVFPERWVEEREGAINSEIIQMADGPAGILGHIKGAAIRDLQQNPNFTAAQLEDRLERSERVDTGTIAEFSGESTSNVRTGKRGNDIMSAAIDYTVRNAQKVFEVAKEQEIRIAARIEKAYHGNRKSFFVGWPGVRGQHIDYDPQEIWETDKAFVAYSMAGTDINNLAVAGGQRVSLGTMSKRTFAQMDPMIEDAEAEFDTIVAEQIEQSILVEFLQPGTMSVVDKARVRQLVKQDKMDLAEAIMKVQKEAQERQASVDQEGLPTAVDPMSPEAQPGIAQPGQGAEAGSQIPEPTNDMQNLNNIFRMISGTQNAGAA